MRVFKHLSNSIIMFLEAFNTLVVGLHNLVGSAEIATRGVKAETAIEYVADKKRLMKEHKLTEAQFNSFLEA